MFEQLHESDQRGEFFGSMCRWHQRKDGRITIYEIIVEQKLRGNGHGRTMIERLIALKPNSILAQCPADLPANAFYQHLGFSNERTWRTKSGRQMNQWVLPIRSKEAQTQ